MNSPHPVSVGCKSNKSWESIVAEAGPLTWQGFYADLLVVVTTFLICYTAAVFFFETLFPALNSRRHGVAATNASAVGLVGRSFEMCGFNLGNGQQAKHWWDYHSYNHYKHRNNGVSAFLRMKNKAGGIVVVLKRIDRVLTSGYEVFLRAGSFHGAAFATTFGLAWISLTLVIFEIGASPPSCSPSAL